MKVSCSEFAQMYKMLDEDKKFLLDIRDPNEVASGSLSGSVNIPLTELEQRFIEIPANKEIYIYCMSGARAEKAEMYLMHKGIKSIRYANPGGYKELKDLF